MPSLEAPLGATYASMAGPACGTETERAKQRVTVPIRTSLGTWPVYWPCPLRRPPSPAPRSRVQGDLSKGPGQGSRDPWPWAGGEVGCQSQEAEPPGSARSFKSLVFSL